MGVNLENLEAALDAVEKETEKETVASPETEVKTSLEAKTEADSKPKHGGANERIRELVSATKELKTELESTSTTLKERDAEIAKLVELLQSKEQDSRIVGRINELYETKPEAKPLLEILDKAVRGEEVNFAEFSKEIAKSNLSKEDKANAQDSLIKTKELLDATKNDLEAQIADQRHEVIIHRTELLTNNYISQLPEEYGEDDIRIVRESLADRIDWDKIDSNPELLQAEFKKGFESTLKWYGSPKGAVKASKESKTKDTEVTPEKLQSFIKQDWGKLKTVEDKGSKRIEPEISDADFAAAMAESLRNVRRFQR